MRYQFSALEYLGLLAILFVLGTISARGCLYLVDHIDIKITWNNQE